MKKILILIVLALSCAINVSKGQEGVSDNFISKGDWLAGGNMSFLAADGNTAFTLTPMAAYFAGEKLAVGLAVSYSSEGSFNTFSVLPSVRYYFSTKRLAPFTQFGLGVASESTVIAAGSLGLDYFLSKNVAFESNLSFFQFVQSNNGSQSGLGLTAGLQFFIR